MAEQQLDGLLFSRSEFLVLMDALKAPDLIGLDNDRLIPSSREEHQSLILQGIEHLQARGLMRMENDLHVINSELLMMARIVSDPAMVTVVLTHEPGHGVRQFNYYQVDQWVVECTQPSEQVYRLASLPNLPFQMERIAFLLPVGQPASAPVYEFDVAQDRFFQAREAAAEQIEKAQEILDPQHRADEVSSALAASMAAPVFSGTVAFLKISEEKIADAYNLAVLQGKEAAWLILPADAEAQRLEVKTIVQGEFATTLAEIRGRFTSQNGDNNL